jgi:hypothetical protein
MELIMNFRNFFLVYLITCFLASSTLSQDFRRWEPEKGVAVRQGTHLVNLNWRVHNQPEFATHNEGDRQGESGLVWTDCRDGERDVFLQIFDGRGDERFERGGLKIGDTPNQVQYAVLAPCSDGGWFAAWDDHQIQDMSSRSFLICTKISAEGETMWGEGLEGITVYEARWSFDYAQIIEDTEGGCFIVGQTYVQEQLSIVVLHLLENGEIDPDWPEAGLVINPERRRPYYPYAISDGNGGVWVAFQVDEGGEDPHNDIYMNRITAEGELIWDRDGVEVCVREGNQRRPVICEDGRGGVYAAWSDASQGAWDTRIQRINWDGELMWEEDGVGLNIDGYGSIGIMQGDNNTAIIAWISRSGRIFTNKVGGNEEMEKIWDEEAGLNILGDRYIGNFDMCADGTGGAVFGIYGHEDAYVVQRVSAEGEPLWGENGIAVAPALPGKYSSHPVIRRSGDEFSFVWANYLGEGNSLFHQRFDMNGDILLNEGGVMILAGLSGNAKLTGIHENQDGRIMMIWNDWRNRILDDGQLRYFNTPYIQVISGSEPGFEVQLQDQGQVVFPIEELIHVQNLQSIETSDGNIGIVWEENGRIFTQKITWDGEILWDQLRTPCADVGERNVGQGYFQACPDDSGGLLITWESDAQNWSYQAFTQRLDSRGRRMWGDFGVQITDPNEYVCELQGIVSDGENGAVILYKIGAFETGDDLYINHVNHNGCNWGEENVGLAVSVAENDQKESEIVKHRDGYAVLWRDQRNADDNSNPDLYGQFISNEGEILWIENGSPICSTNTSQSNPVVSIDNSGHIWIAWTDRVGRTKQIRCQRINLQPGEAGNPQLLFEAEGSVIWEGENDPDDLQITHDGGNGMWVFWKTGYFNNGQNLNSTHLNSNGERYGGWSEEGNIVSNPTFGLDSYTTNILNGGDDGILVGWDNVGDANGGDGGWSYSDIYIQRIDDDIVSAPEIVAPVPEEFRLFQPFPNPFNSTTTIEYALPYASEVTLNLYNLSGQRVETLVNGKQHAGMHQMTLNACKTPSGLYFVKLEGVGQSVTQKIMLVK